MSVVFFLRINPSLDTPEAAKLSEETQINKPFDIHPTDNRNQFSDEGKNGSVGFGTENNKYLCHFSIQFLRFLRGVSAVRIFK